MSLDFNYIWRVTQRRNRSSRFGFYSCIPSLTEARPEPPSSRSPSIRTGARWLELLNQLSCHAIVRRFHGEPI
eukprot:SM002636S09846  [mRNA]  locus=s2636:251:1604:- [translate_table: standard]